ncbi:uncharacterized protein LOC120847930 [Ixodes scapularis]|uniref:uncharacterized protein LOC120847930 n=1 Tax=Ixodes scapularis TaxID=6945 RepID=UPI001A9DB7E8|nr:uncharacterized protein LOC120847930 [Ixodes scapularis]
MAAVDMPTMQNFSVTDVPVTLHLRKHSPRSGNGSPVLCFHLQRYIGGGISLSEEKFNWAMDEAKSDFRCCTLLAWCLYKDEDLANRSVTGQPSRRNLKYGAVKKKPITPAEMDAIKIGSSHYVKKRKTTVPYDDRIGKARCRLSNFLSKKNCPSKAEKYPQVPLTPPVPLASSNEN